ncbi:putative M18 family aminopeptidase 2 [BD1-7 clade bacterium]|uniref:M18 family aminopeptidase n=1 Tax=BD1-7 clade bacterium TaxID=2029982 RepID=A0A5S9PTX3_9GAMM|nr:putative M18 family aminopeptidase 2 [BD1-7 clade bacterium]
MTDKTTDLNQQLIEFIQSSPTPFHAVKTMSEKLKAAGFQQLVEKDGWSLEAGAKYFVTRNDSSIIAFRYGEKPLAENGIRMLGAHTDSPCLKVKPNPDLNRHGYWQLGVETYGGVLLNPWFDRELSIAGRVSVVDVDGKLHHRLIDFCAPIAMVPSLAIHLDKEANSKRNINAQTHLPVVLDLVDGNDAGEFRSLLAHRVAAEYAELGQLELLEYELSLYDVNPGRIYGLNQAFVAAARLDNLLSCFVGLQALIEADDGQSMLLVCNDHEEVGSASAAGAQGTMLKDFLTRLIGDDEAMIRTLQQSMMISVDNAHAIHPNFASKHDDNHGPQINQGPVIKINANQRYASNSETQAIFKAVCAKQSIPLQSFVVRSDMGCGSTIGPITATEIGVKTLDIGVPTLGMHSIRETAGTKDTDYLTASLKGFLELSETAV